MSGLRYIFYAPANPRCCSPFRSCVLVGNSPGTLPVGAHVIMRFSGFALDFNSPLTRLLLRKLLRESLGDC